MRETTIDEDTVRRMAHLARIHLDEGEAATWVAEFARCLEAFRTLQAIDVSNVEPLSHLEEGGPLNTRVGRPRDSGQSESLLENAPQRQDSCYRVPRAIDAEET